MGKIKIIQTSVALSLVLNNFTDVAILAHAANETLESETDTPSVPSVPNEDTAGIGQESESTDEVQTPSIEGETVGNEESKIPSVGGEAVENEESEIPSSNQGVADVEISEDESTNDLASSDEGVTDELELQNEELQPKASGSGLVQLWQVVPSGQTQEGKTTSEIMKNLQCRPNHNLYPLNGTSQHETYVNSCYVDDALYLGEDANYYYVYLSGYEGKVRKSQSHYFELDLNNDGTKVKYEIQTVAYYVPDSGARTLADEGAYQQAPELNYHTDHLNKADELDESEITPYASKNVQSPSYYANEGGTLYHYLTNNVTKVGGYSKVIVGKAPDFLSANVKYYSYDGVYFYTDWRQIKVNGTGAVNQGNPFYNYYQYLPFRSKTNHQTNAFDTYTSNNGGSGGKLVGTGKYFNAVGDRFGINGALQYAMGIHESGWGKSSLSMNKNNLFGMNATDNNPYGNGTSFPSVEAGINYHADRYLSWGYTDPLSDWRYFGSHVGNKGSGMNVKYASDPFWGEKIAGWYYRFDQANGLKDYNYYSIGVKSSNEVYNVRSQASTNAQTYYQTKNGKSNLRFGNYPVLITGEENGYYRIQTDTPIVNGKPLYNEVYNFKTSEGYISKNAITALNHNAFRPINGIASDLRGWNYINNRWYYFDNNGIALKGWQWIDGIKYYFNQEGQMQIGWQWIDGHQYYFNESGHLTQWWQWIDGIHYYFNGMGQMVTGWQWIDGNKYYFNQSGHSMTGLVNIGNDWYYFDELGKMETGWKYLNDCWHYFDNNGVALKGWQWIDGIKYYFNQEGQMQIGWQWIDGHQYYFNESGHLTQWWRWIDGIHYYFNGMGQMVTGWQWIDGNQYYFNQSGHSMTGLVSIGNDWYYFDELGKMETGWKYLNDCWYYFNNNGMAVKDWQWIDGIKYYFNQEGQMQTGWQWISNNWYYFNDAGHMLQWWQWIDGIQYYFNGMGQMLIGHHYIDGVAHYFNESGHLVY